MTRDQANEIERLASLLATARVRRTVVGIGQSANKNETVASTHRNLRRAREALQKYLNDMVTEGP